MSWVDLLTDVQKDEIRVLKNFRDRSISEVGKAQIEVTRSRTVLAMAEQNLKVAETAVFEINDRIAMRIRQFLADKSVGAVDIDDLA